MKKADPNEIKLLPQADPIDVPKIMQDCLENAVSELKQKGFNGMLEKRRNNPNYWKTIDLCKD